MEKSLILAAALFLFAGCSDLPCMKSYKFHLKANMSKTAAEKDYYTREAQVFDNECARYNESEYQKRKQEELSRHK